MKILVTGGAGYIGSHTCVKLLEQGYEVVVVDNLVNGSSVALERVEVITGKPIVLEVIDVLDVEGLDRIFASNDITAVVHFAGLKNVADSVKKPDCYYESNVKGTMNILDAMRKYRVKRLIFSSSATVYGSPEVVPIPEDAPLLPVNPYGRTKFISEMLIRDYAAACEDFSAIILRYFNPVGAHSSGLIGEDPHGEPGNLMPYVAKVAVGHLPQVDVFGGDYATHDGTGLRDYIHVEDLAEGHLAALRKSNSRGVHTYNLGTGHANSVLDMIAAFETVTGQKIPYRIRGRRPGDAAISYASPELARTDLEWCTKRDVADMCRDIWRWQSQNPDGFAG